MAPSGALKRVSPFNHTRPTFIRRIPAPPSGYVAPPNRKDHETISNQKFASRMALYQRAYNVLSPAEWKHYTTFGIQTFESFETFFQSINQSSEEDENLRIAQYYKYHLENNIVVPSSLLKRVGEIEIVFEALSSHEEFLHLSLAEMQEYLDKKSEKQQAQRPFNTPDTNSSFVDRESYPDSPRPGSDEFEDPSESLFDGDVSMDIPDPDDMEPFEVSPFGKGEDFDLMLVESVVRLENKFNKVASIPSPSNDDDDEKMTVLSPPRLSTKAIIKPSATEKTPSETASHQKATKHSNSSLQRAS
jgi:hypothetical protein